MDRTKKSITSNNLGRNSLINRGHIDAKTRLKRLAKLLSIIYVIVAQAIKGIAKDFNKMSAKIQSKQLFHIPL